MTEQNSNLDKYDTIFESVLSDAEHELLLSSEDEDKEAEITKMNLKKRKTNLKIKRQTKKLKETAKDRLLQWNNFYSKSFGIWIQCTRCDKWRKVMEYEEEHEVPEDWCCSMSLSGIKKCDEPEEITNEDFSPVNLIPGTIVWAKYDTYPWWPAIIEDDPDIEEYYWIEKNGTCSYNVTFLDDKVSRAWVSASNVRPFLEPPKQRYLSGRNAKYSPLLVAAEIKAKKAMNMTIQERLENFSFARTYNGKWGTALNIDDSYEDEKDLTKMLLEEMDNIETIEFSDSDSKSISPFELKKNETDSKSDQFKKPISNNFVCNVRCKKNKMPSIRNKKLIEMHSKQECKRNNKAKVVDLELEYAEETKLLNKLIDTANVYLDEVETEETKMSPSNTEKEDKNIRLKFLKDKTRTQNNIVNSAENTDSKSLVPSTSKMKKHKTSAEVSKIKNTKEKKLEHTEENLNNKENSREKNTINTKKHINNQITNEMKEKTTSISNRLSKCKYKPPIKGNSKNNKSEVSENNNNIINKEAITDSINLHNLNNITKEEKLMKKEMNEKSIDEYKQGNEDDTNNNIQGGKISKYTNNTEINKDVKKIIQNKKDDTKKKNSTNNDSSITFSRASEKNEDNTDNKPLEQNLTSSKAQSKTKNFRTKEKNNTNNDSSITFSRTSEKNEDNTDNKPLEQDLISSKAQSKTKNFRTKGSKEQLKNIMKTKKATNVINKSSRNSKIMSTYKTPTVQNDLSKTKIKEKEDLEIDEVKNGEEIILTEENKSIYPPDDEVNGEMSCKDSNKESFSFSLELNLQQPEEDSDPFEAD